MAEIQGGKGSPTLDMTPMVDLAFLLVTFFMLTAQFKPQEVVLVDTPKSVSTKEIPEKDILTVTIDSLGQAYWAFENEDVRREALNYVAGKRQISFTPKQMSKFSKEGMFGVPIEALGAYLDADAAKKKEIMSKYHGIPYDSTNNELFLWLQGIQVAHSNARTLQKEEITAGTIFKSKEIMDRLKYAIKADGSAKYIDIQKVINVFQDKQLGINSFSLITDMEKF